MDIVTPVTLLVPAFTMADILYLLVPAVDGWVIADIVGDASLHW